MAGILNEEDLDIEDMPAASILPTMYTLEEAQVKYQQAEEQAGKSQKKKQIAEAKRTHAENQARNNRYMKRT